MFFRQEYQRAWRERTGAAAVAEHVVEMDFERRESKVDCPAARQMLQPDGRVAPDLATERAPAGAEQVVLAEIAAAARCDPGLEESVGRPLAPAPIRP